MWCLLFTHMHVSVQLKTGSFQKLENCCVYMDICNQEKATSERSVDNIEEVIKRLFMPIIILDCVFVHTSSDRVSCMCAPSARQIATFAAAIIFQHAENSGLKHDESANNNKFV